MTKTTVSFDGTGISRIHRGVKPYPVNETGGDRGRKRKRAHRESQETKGKTVEEIDLLALYFEQISKYPLLSIQEEQEIGGKLKSLRQEISTLEKKYLNQEEDSKYKAARQGLDDSLLQIKNRMITSNLRLGALPFGPY